MSSGAVFRLFHIRSRSMALVLKLHVHFAKQLQTHANWF